MLHTYHGAKIQLFSRIHKYFLRKMQNANRIIENYTFCTEFVNFYTFCRST